MGQREFSIKLEMHELQAIRDHAQSVANLDGQIGELARQLAREKRSLELAWRAAFFRNARRMELPEDCPAFMVGNRLAINIEADGTARWQEDTDGEQ